MELKELEGLNISIEYLSNEIAEERCRILKNEFPNEFWNIEKRGSYVDIYTVYNEQKKGRSVFVCPDYIFEKLFLNKEEEVNSIDNINWEQRRYEIAKEMIANQNIGINDIITARSGVSFSIEIADLLIEKLKAKQ